MDKPILKNTIKAEINGTATVTNNMEEVKAYALAMKEYYSTLVFNDDQIKEAKNERASINKMVKKVADYRKDIVTSFNKPLEEFVSAAKETENILKETSTFVDNQVKKYEEEEKEKKKEGCQKIYDEMIGDLKELVSFEKIFNDKWLNKTTKYDEVKADIQNIINKVNSGLEAIKTLKSEFETEIINTFLEDFDVTKAIFKNTQLKERKEAMAKTEIAKEETKTETIKEMVSKPIQVNEEEPVKEYTLKIKATYTKLVELRKFMDINDIKYEKVK
ncbi:DUF1351 domain-containing protein [uncultured Thomasclavelia sp.]|uniref:DUF1351 domain-containing protein n=1 Tax=uncultured Thomasclavelia sp. TaxID=3025759 RepID=UPI00259263F8|nr:DUF1351 domain-containing protein [uncultured Thomasclavelia sp.]